MSLYKAAMFDFDGTVTPKGHYEPSPEMVRLLLETARKMPIAFCTGRQLESFLKHGYNYLMEGMKDGEDCLENIFLFGENGSVGYYYDLEKADFEQFYEVEWPESFYPKEEFKTLLAEAVKDYGELYYNAHKVAIVMRTKLHSTPDRNIEDVYDLSHKIYETTYELLQRLKPDFEDYLHIGNSGIGVIVCPAKGDKDMGIKKFAEYLKTERQLSISDDAREILVVGDSPERSGNDHYFLAGKYGTPFSVGALCEGQKYPMGVYAKEGKRLLHDHGTSCLIRDLLLTSSVDVV